MKIPHHDALDWGTVAAHIVQRFVNSVNKIWNVFVLISQSHRPDAQRVCKEKPDHRPKNPKRPALVVHGIRGLRFGRTRFGSFLAHGENLAGVHSFGKEIDEIVSIMPISRWGFAGGLAAATAVIRDSRRNAKFTLALCCIQLEALICVLNLNSPAQKFVSFEFGRRFHLV